MHSHKVLGRRLGEWQDGEFDLREPIRKLVDAPEHNDDKAYPIVSDDKAIVDLATIAPTPTEDFPIELRTSPPTPTLLFPPSLQTAPPTKDGATYHPTETPTSDPNPYHPTYAPTAAPTTHAPSTAWKHAVTQPWTLIKSEWDADDTIVTSVLITFFLIVMCVYCVCCKRNKDAHDVGSWGATNRPTNKGEYSAIESVERLGSSSPRSPDGRVVMHNPMAETSPLLSPPRNRDRVSTGRREAREERDRDRDAVPLRQARQTSPQPTRGGDNHSDMDDDLNI